MKWVQKLTLPILVVLTTACFYATYQAMYVAPINPKLLKKEQDFQEKFGQYYGPSVEEVLFRLHEPLNTSVEE